MSSTQKYRKFTSNKMILEEGSKRNPYVTAMRVRRQNSGAHGNPEREQARAACRGRVELPVADGHIDLEAYLDDES
jgi:hypothetical protein